MILASGLSPAWQHILVFDRFVRGEVNRAQRVHWCASGKVLNVAIALDQLGGPAKAMAPVGGPFGAAIRRDFQRQQIEACWVETEVRTRVCTSVLDADGAASTELVEDAQPLAENDLDAFEDAFAVESQAADVVVLSGSLPTGTASDYYQRLLKRTTTRAVLDIRGPELLATLECQPFVVKPNRRELARTLNRDLSCDDDALDAMRELLIGIPIRAGTRAAYWGNS